MNPPTASHPFHRVPLESTTTTFDVIIDMHSTARCPFRERFRVSTSRE